MILGCLGRAIDGAQTTLAAVLQKARFWQAQRDRPINERQRLMLNRLLDGFEEKLTTSKWAIIAKCLPDTALRDILDLVERGPNLICWSDCSTRSIVAGRIAPRRRNQSAFCRWTESS